MGYQVDAVDAVHITPSAKSFYVDHIGYAHLCCSCVCMRACWKYLLSSAAVWTLGHRVVAALPQGGHQMQQLLTVHESLGENKNAQLCCTLPLTPNLREHESSCHVHISAIKSEKNLWNHCTLYSIWTSFYLISIKANQSCVCLFNTWLSEMKAESMTGQVWNFPVFQMTISWMQTIILGYSDYIRWNMRNRLVDVVICSPIHSSRSNMKV